MLNMGTVGGAGGEVRGWRADPRRRRFRSPRRAPTVAGGGVPGSTETRVDFTFRPKMAQLQLEQEAVQHQTR